MPGGFAYLAPYLFASGTTGAPLGLPFPVTPLLKRTVGGVGMLTNCPSPTPFGLGLGPTDPGTSNVAQETLGLRRTRFSRVSRYLCRHSHFCPLQRSSRSAFAAGRTLLYHDSYEPSTASVASLSPDHCRRHDTRPVSYYALFEWWLLLSQHPGCLCTATSFPT
jgi:hypothetical protein